MRYSYLLIMNKLWKNNLMMQYISIVLQLVKMLACRLVTFQIIIIQRKWENLLTLESRSRSCPCVVISGFQAGFLSPHQGFQGTDVKEPLSANSVCWQIDWEQFNWSQPEMEKGGCSGRAECANFSHLCNFLFFFTRVKKWFAFFVQFFGIYTNFWCIFEHFLHILCVLFCRLFPSLV